MRPLQSLVANARMSANERHAHIVTIEFSEYGPEEREEEMVSVMCANGREMNKTVHVLFQCK